ncbi:GntR family transcriptional regulator [Prosthecobacter vanneervenii]|uniref:DNA-binding GntR family transcriptional regulator n=1 Tax=Prosthecobacter vanneervenii TaxID=48466 RepID=A0A7W7YFL6_9BACT|nr:GntR family transcriptional regulator [Prosthecobacter vanneervenii]MBB5035281.1 DNA-binding GntR family transcriptional regulator [Prosthecobacter vanneervenii]
MKTAVASPSRTDSTASLLRAEILNGSSAPGALLAESAVARRLGVSRVPVREALFALEREGLVEFSPTGRAFVKDLTPQDFEELYVLRLALEPLASRLAAQSFRADVTLLEENLAATRRARSVQDVTLLDLDFHQIILETSGNARLVKLWNSLRGELELWLGRLHRTHQMQTKETLQQTVDAHQSIVESFKTQTPSTCERLMREHILGWREWLPLAP